MTPAARIAAAISVLDQVLEGQPAEQALTRWARGARYAGSKDRAAVRDHVYQVLRCRRSFACLGGGETGRALMIGALRATDQDPVTLFTGEGHAPPPLSEAERAAGHPPRTEAAQADLPDWLWQAFRASLGDGAEAAARALKDRAPVQLRVNTRFSTVSQAIESLFQNGIEVQPCRMVDTALTVTSGARGIANSVAYLNGHVELQDASSQAAMAALDLSGVRTALDFCAGGGGKTLALAARSDAQWYAHDANPGRMTDLPARAARAGVGVTLLPAGAADGAAPYDLVLCDVPCSGSGTWRRTPDAKWRLTEAALAALLEVQQRILSEAAALLRPGGCLAYTTCSVLRPENEDQVAAFLDRNPGWTVTGMRRWPIGRDGDGFFLAQLWKSHMSQ